MAELLSESTIPSIPADGGKRWHQWIDHQWVRVALVAVIAVLLASGLGTIALVQNYGGLYHRDVALAHDGVDSVRAAGELLKGLSQNPFDETHISQAQGDFSVALADFTRVNSDLSGLPSVFQATPHYGALLAGARRIVPLAITASQAGIVGCQLLSLVAGRLRNPLDATAQGLTTADLSHIQSDVNHLQSLLNTASTQIGEVQPGDEQLDPHIGPALAAARADLPAARQAMQDAQAVLSVAPQVLGIGSPSIYLLEVLDSTELRPGGGFIGNYGLATLAGARLTNTHISDVYLLDGPYQAAGHSIPIPSAYSWFPYGPSWSLRDSNLDADFPTVARDAEQIYAKEGGTTHLQGVIAVTPYLIADAMAITGPIYVSQFHETVTPKNLIDLIHFHELGNPNLPEAQLKVFTADLFQDFVARVRQVAPANLSRFVSLITNALHTKDLQIYSNAAPVETLLENNDLGGTIEAPSGDSLFVVDANITGNKANEFMTYTMHDQVTVSATGTATHVTTLTYSWPYSAESSANNYGDISNSYTDYVRVYVPPGSTLQSQSGWIPKGTSNAFGREVWAGLFQLAYGTSGTITLRWVVQHAATKDAASWQYHYLIERQAGSIAWKLSLSVALPSCSHIEGKPTGLTTRSPESATATEVVAEDTRFGLNYTC